MWQGVFVDAKAGWVREVVGELTVHLEDVAIVLVAGDGNLGLEWAVGDVCLSTYQRRIVETLPLLQLTVPAKGAGFVCAKKAAGPVGVGPGKSSGSVWKY